MEPCRRCRDGDPGSAGDTQGRRGTAGSSAPDPDAVATGLGAGCAPAGAAPGACGAAGQLSRAIAQPCSTEVLRILTRSWSRNLFALMLTEMSRELRLRKKWQTVDPKKMSREWSHAWLYNG